MLIYDKYLDSLSGQNPQSLETWLKEANSCGPLDLIPENEPQPDDSLGNLINKLNCATIQMWHNQEQMYLIRRQTTNQFIAQYQDSLDQLHIIIKRSCDLNVQRARIVDAIDRKAYEMGHPPTEMGDL